MPQDGTDPPRNVLTPPLNEAFLPNLELPFSTPISNGDDRTTVSTDEFDSDMPVRERHIEAEFVAVNMEGRAGS
jgi:hypothetical protein